MFDALASPRQFDMGERVGLEITGCLAQPLERLQLRRPVLCVIGSATDHDIVRAQRFGALASGPSPGTRFAACTTPFPWSAVDWRCPVFVHACRSSTA